MLGIYLTYLSDKKNDQLNNNFLSAEALTRVDVELPKFPKKLEELETDLDRWLYFLKYADDLTFIPDQLTSLKDAFAALNKVTWNAQQL